jgi:hypothetical protein
VEVELEPGQYISRLKQWPAQIKLVPAKAPYFSGADLLIAADCTAFACADMHERFMKDRITLIGCPKLDQVNYAEKLTDILTQNSINSIAVARVEVPCCAGLVHAAQDAIGRSGKNIPLRAIIISIEGRVLSDCVL